MSKNRLALILILTIYLIVDVYSFVEHQMAISSMEHILQFNYVPTYLLIIDWLLLIILFLSFTLVDFFKRTIVLVACYALIFMAIFQLFYHQEIFRKSFVGGTFLLPIIAIVIIIRDKRKTEKGRGIFER